MNLPIVPSSIFRMGLVAAVASLAGCSAGYTTGNTASVLLIIVAVNDGSPLQSDVLSSGSVTSNSVELNIAVRYKNPTVTFLPSVQNAVIVDRYEVKYRRSDGRGVEGQDVPFTISGNMSFGIDVSDSATSTFPVEVVRAQAKLEPPLRNLRSVTGTSLGGALVLTMFADITLHGHTISGQTVTATGSLQIDFADFSSTT